MQSSTERPLANPYVAGVGLGLVLLVSFLILGQGIGASGAAARAGTTAVHAVAPAHVEGNSYLSKYVTGKSHPMNNWLVFEVIGIFLGGAISAVLAGRRRSGITRGPRISKPSRLALALLGGVIMGFAARLSRGCTSGQALSGGALLSVGSWIFMLSVFGGGYALAFFLRREWT
jgi:uncharacterized membrane protein YedE/YeeE